MTNSKYLEIKHIFDDANTINVQTDRVYDTSGQHVIYTKHTITVVTYSRDEARADFSQSPTKDTGGRTMGETFETKKRKVSLWWFNNLSADQQDAIVSDHFDKAHPTDADKKRVVEQYDQGLVEQLWPTTTGM